MPPKVVFFTQSCKLTLPKNNFYFDNLFLLVVFINFARMDYIVWHITESEQELRDSLQHPEYFAEKVGPLKPGSRRMLEVLAVRRAMKELFYGEEQQVIYDEHGRPSLDPSCWNHHSGAVPFISISHTTDYAAVICSEQPVGIDIERRAERVARVTNRFLKPEEVARLSLLSEYESDRLKSQLDDSDRQPAEWFFTLFLHLCWSAKEAAFKVLGPDYYDLQRLTTVTLLSLQLRQITLQVEGREKPLSVHFDCTDDYVLTWVELD